MPDAAPGKRDTGGAPTTTACEPAQRVESTPVVGPKAGAVCVSAPARICAGGAG